MADDNVQHGIDDSPSGDAQKGATLGGIGGVVTGAVAGAAAGPAGAVIGAIIGGVAGSVASGAAVAAVDRVDNDNTVTGIGHGHTTDAETTLHNAGHSVSTTAHNATAGVSHAANSGIGTGVSTETALGETTPSIKTGGYANDGTPDTRGLGEKTVDAITGDSVDDKTGKVVNHS